MKIDYKNSCLLQYTYKWTYGNRLVFASISEVYSFLMKNVCEYISIVEIK